MHGAYMLSAYMPRTAKPLTTYPRPSVAVDVVAMTVEKGGLHVALYKRMEPPHKGAYALPGGFVRIDESLDEAAARLLAQKAGFTDVFLEQLYTFSDVH